MALELSLKVRSVKVGQTKTGKPYMFIGVGSGVGGFVRSEDFGLFEEIQKGDICDFDVFSALDSEEGSRRHIVFMPVCWSPSPSR